MSTGHTRSRWRLLSSLSAISHLRAELTALLAQETTSGGFWRLTYTDKDFRILYTNLGNVFVLVR